MRVRFTGLRSVTRSTTLPNAISATRTLTELSVELADVVLADHPEEREITLLAVSVSNLVVASSLQLEMPVGLGDEPHRPGTATGSARWALDRAVDQVRDKFGRDACGYAPVVFRESSGVPDEFRELAQADRDVDR